MAAALLEAGKESWKHSALQPGKSEPFSTRDSSNPPPPPGASSTAYTPAFLSQMQMGGCKGPHCLAAGGQWLALLMTTFHQNIHPSQINLTLQVFTHTVYL